MGTFAKGSVNIYFDNEKDATKVHEILSHKETEKQFIKILGKKEGEGYYEFYDFADKGEKEVSFELSSSRVQNTEWQSEQIIKLLKKLVKTKKIKAVSEFVCDIMVQGESYYCDRSEFEGGE